MSSPHDRTALRGIAYMVGSSFFFSLMTVLVKLAGRTLPSQEIVLARAAIALVLSYFMVRHLGIPLLGSRRPLLFVRGLLGFIGLTCVFYAVTHLPLADATVIQYLYPALTALGAALFLGERFGPRLVVASAVSLLGVLLVAKPAVLFGARAASLDSLAVAVAVAGAASTALAYVVVRKLSASEHPAVIVLYFPLISVPATLPTVWHQLVWPGAFEWLVLLGVGVTTQIGQICLTKGLEAQPAGRATAISYLQVVWAGLWGVIFFSEIPDPWTLVGGGLVLLGTLASALAPRD